MEKHKIFNDILAKFIENQDFEVSKAMKAYLRNQFEFLGIQKPKRVLIQKDFFKLVKNQKFIDWEFVNFCWKSDFREMQFLAIDYLTKKIKFLKEDDFKYIEILLTSKMWWDTIDLLASKIVGEYFSIFPNNKLKIIDKWILSSNIWLNRTAILFQLKYKKNTDEKLLLYIIGELKFKNDFWIQKAIGWALREYSKTNKSWVKNVIDNNQHSDLVLKEASKYLN